MNAAPLAERLVCFFVDGQEFGVPIRAVKETIEPRPITRIFLVADFIAGLINLRGEVVAVLDLGRLLGVRSTVVGSETRIVILRARSSGKAPAAGLLVDRLSDVRDVDPGMLRSVPSTVPADAAAFITGVARVDDHPLLLLDLERVFESERLKAYRHRA